VEKAPGMAKGMPSIKIDVHYSEISINSFKEQGIISS
jgi:hypothetical protein